MQSLLRTAVLAAIMISAEAQAEVARPMSQDEWCKRLTPRLPGISMAMCEKAALVPTGASSYMGFPILAKRIPARTTAGAKPVRVLLLGCIHGDELTASAIVFQWLQWINSAQAQKFQWNVVPVLNPDGLLAPRPTRVNANGVDLNRNFPTPGWQQDAPAYWAKKTGKDPRRFPGEAPLSEPESKWVNDEIARFKPDVIISVHAPFGVLDFDGPAQPPRNFGRLMFNRVGIYPGSLGNYGGMHKKVPVVTIELPNALDMPPVAESRRIWQDMLNWIEKNVAQENDRQAALQRTSAKVEKSASTAATATR
ncbi:MAG TPA: M14 family zinc carboxypeptidase [Noviherbaspirillum sp.]|uniref:M14 family zinc carboxypeptidase n=1 Tax=Noviherbaspirillum sp. TaxID=1926288 RepID=UPI002DDD7A35|nr:M14 family zinc carboxypeptidase [Noviherbaspirillum sp.]HEV2611183.1 M14 family zinc carboxypeptidase [Noviherbaspirillum sp.]